MFWKKKQETRLTSDEYEKILKRIVELSSSFEEFKIKLLKLETDFRSIRGKLNSHISGEKTEDDIESIFPTSKGLNKITPFG